MVKKIFSKKNQFLFASISLAASSTLFAGAMGAETKAGRGLYVGIEGGGSISMNAHFQPDIHSGSSNIFLTPQNTDWSGDLGSAGMVGAFIGYEYNPNVAFQFGYAYRTGYHWDVLTLEDDAVMAAFGTPTDVYDQYRVKGIQINTFLVDMLLKPSVNWGGFIPYAKIGVGASVNHVGQIQNIDIPINTNTTTPPISFNTIVNSHTTASFAWDAGVGADYYFNKAWSVGVNYRFVDAGVLQSGSRFYDTILLDRGTLSPFKAKNIYLNEVSASLAYHFDLA